MSKIARRLALISLAALAGAVGIGPRRETGSDRGDERREDGRIGPRYSAPAPAASAVQPRVGIAPRAADSGFERRRSGFGRVSGISPSVAGPVGIQRRVGTDTVTGRHFWHESGGRRFSHFYDGRVHWYGYPFGADFFWLRPFGGFWWTWDVRFSRWVCWNDGFWWWLGPGGVQFVYINDNYYPYEAVRQAGHNAPPAAPSGSRGAWTSPNGRRLVEVSGPDAQAILYDKTREAPAYICFLGKDAKMIRFSAAAPGLPPTIVVEFSNGSIAVFDYDGHRIDTAKPASVTQTPPEGEVPPATPSDLPPPPEDLPPPPR